ncbi:SDR family oxidoreductase [Gordonia sp. LSe1-13]|uniref:SDR family oxidoreductase n=1 Tax=Gordonia sesuvii TaxID=3116777 RepID=A0ABU7M8N5_9ACTN|nr:SDR family oxidoreductase [Gordonia sp. LSe1-13]
MTTAVITGAAGGIGAAIAHRLSTRGTRCVVVDRNPIVEQVAENIGGTAVVGDLADPATSETAVARAGERVDHLVLNAGMNCTEKDLATLDPDRYHTVVAINQHAVVWGLRAGLPVMRRQGHGSIVITASLAALHGVEQDVVYTMTKHAVIGLVRASWRPLAREGIALNAICPGLVDTPLTAPARERFTQAGIQMLTADRVAEAAVGLLHGDRSGVELVIRPGQDPMPYVTNPVP